MKNINHIAPVICSKTIVINADSKKVWAVLIDIDNWSLWNTDISKSKLERTLKAGAAFDWKSNGAKIHSTLHAVEPFKKLDWTGKAIGTFAIHNWTLTEANGQTSVFAEESMEGFLAKPFKKSFTKNLENGMQNWLEFLKQKCEK